MTHWKNTTGGGCLSQNNLRRRSSRKLRLTVFAALVAVVAAIAVPVAANAGVLEDVVSGVASFFGLNQDNDVELLAAGEQNKVADESTLSNWSNQGEYGFDDTTENIGRIWTDKTVQTGDIQISGSMSESIKIGDSDFLVGLSALSSMSNTMTSSTTPLDIVLVLDMSGSMDDPLGTSTQVIYSPVYANNVQESEAYYSWGSRHQREAGTYYALVDGEYVRITERTHTEEHGYGWNNEYDVHDSWHLPDGTEVYPKTNQNDNQQNHVQFYTRRTQTESVSKVEGLKTAVNQFIDATNEQNANLPEGSKHEISIVKFASNSTDAVGNNTYIDNRYDPPLMNYSQVVTDFTDNADSLKSIVNQLGPTGATRADYGMEQAQRVLEGDRQYNLGGARTDSKKVVIFFTDGQPTQTDSWSASVANGAISAAHTMKNSGVTIYSIGVFADADPDNTTDNSFNCYMHAVSSNYPDATGYQAPSMFGDGNMGDRAEDSDFYKAATNSEELNQIFADISEDINDSSGAPTQTVTGSETMSGYITFTDKLGAYMKVDGMNSVVFANTKYTQSEDSTENPDGSITYHFSGEANSDIYPNGNLNQLKITVTPGATLAEGDTVTVQIPASLIPTRYFDVDTDAKTMDITEAYPIRIFYGVSLKEGVAESIAAGVPAGGLSQEEFNALDSYVANHPFTQDDKSYATFLSNDWTSGEHGTTTSNFEPSSGNAFYYYTENTTIYSDPDCTQPVGRRDSIDTSATYYYKKSYWKLTDSTSDAAELVETSVELSGADAYRLATGVDAEGNCCVPAGTRHTAMIRDLVTNKTPQGGNTATANSVVNPSWVGSGATESINAQLGNNGRLSIELPGTLSVTKNVEVSTGVDAGQFADTEFAFKITMADAANGSFKAQITDAEGNLVQPAKDSEETYFDLKFTNGVSDEFRLRDGDTLTVYGLSDGWTYSVAESALPAGFTQTTPADGAAATGTIDQDNPAEAEFTNTYDIEEDATIPGETDLAGTKTLTPRPWQDGDEFTFVIMAADGSRYDDGSPVQTADQPMPEQTQVTLTNEQANNALAGTQVPFHFGNISYDAPGTYNYIIREAVRSAGEEGYVPGVTYATNRYYVRVVVTDNGEGKLTADATMYTLVNNAPGQEVKSADFTNIWSADDATLQVEGVKRYSDTTKPGVDTPEPGTFFFRLTATDGGPLPTPGEDVEPVATGDDYMIVTTLPAGRIQFGTATYNDDMVGKTYNYTIEEVIEVDGKYVPVSEAIEANGDGEYVKDGMTYDDTKFEVTVTIQTTDEGGIEAVPEITGGTVVEGDYVFTNGYDPAPATLVGDAAIHGDKVLNGRDMVEGEAFTFTLEGADTATTTAMTDGTITFADKDAAESYTQNVTEATNGTAKGFNFGDVTITKPGTYTFRLSETGYTADGANYAGAQLDSKINGIKFDRHGCTVTVDVKDNNGQLGATVSYSTENGGATFTNAYTASETYGTDVELTMSKTLDGRDMEAREFSFEIAATGDNAEAAWAKLAAANVTSPFRNAQGASDGVELTWTILENLAFNQNDAGETFTYEVKEQIPADAEGNGITYDKSIYQVAITVVDDADGTMHTVTTVTRTQNAAGGAVTEVVGSYDSSKGTVEPKLSFENSYKGAPVEVNPETETRMSFNKVVTGRDWLESDSFTFTMTKVSFNGETGDDALAIMPVPANNGEVSLGGATHAENEEVPFNFGTMTFTEPGTYVYHVDETNTGTDGKGLTYDEKTTDLTIVIGDPGNGQLKVDGIYTSNGDTFTNKYESSVTYTHAVNLSVEKTLNGHAMAEGQFTITMTPADEESAKKGELWQDGKIQSVEIPVNAADDGETAVMPLNPPMKFDQSDSGRTFTYTFRENIPDPVPAGYAYDTTIYTVVIKPADNQDGTMTVKTVVTKTPAEGEPVEMTYEYSGTGDPAGIALAFTNSYGGDATTGDVAADVDATKTLSGRDMTADEFDFEIVTRGADTNDGAEFNSEKVATGTNAAAEDDTAGDVTFTGTNGAMTYTLAKLDAAVDAGYATKNATGDNTVWTLYYTARELTNALPVNVTAVDGSTSFDFTVTVTDNNDGTLNAEVNAPEGGIAFKNVFTKPVVVGGEAGVKVQKTFTGREDDAWLDADSFEFTIAAVTEGAPMPDPATTTVSNKSDAVDGVTGAYSSVFGNITFNKTDLDGEGSKVFEYTITETAPADNGNGITKDTHVAKVTITVTDNGTDLSADVAYDNSGATTDADKAVTNAAAFTNTYEATGETTVNTKAQFELQKQLINTPWDGQEFTFNISGVDGDKNAAPLPVKGDAEVSSVTVNGPDSEGGNTAALDFGTITFTKPGTYTYTVSEELPDGAADADPVANGIRYDTTDIVVTVTVEDDNNGGLTSEVSFMEGEDKTFTNVYESGLDYGAAGGLQIVKNLFGHDINADDFTFIVTPEDRESADLLGMTEWTDGEAEEVSVTAAQLSANEEGEYVATATMKLFNGVKFDLSNNGDEYGYTITERPNVTDAAYKNDTTKYQVTISVSDEGDGVMKVTTTVTPEGGDPIDYVYTSDATSDAAQVTFNNRYDVEGTLGGEGNIAIVAHKTLNNAELEGNDFEFKVVGTKANGETQVEATGSNDVDGNITFTPIEYDSDKLAADVASGVAEVDDQGDTEVYTYAYVVRETGLPTGVTANVASFPITVTVTDDHSGVLAVEVVYDATDPNVDSLEFVNTYGDAEGTPIKVGGKKELKPSSEGGSTPSLEDIAGKFTFTLTGEVVDENGDTVEGEKAVMPDETKTKNDANGDVDFGNIEFTMENVFGSSATDDGTEPGEGEVPGEDVETPTEPDQGDETENQGGSTTVDTPEGESVTDGVETVPSEGDESTDVDQPAATDPSASEEADTETTEEGSSQNDVAMLAAENGDEATGDPEPESLGQPRTKIFKYTVTETGTVDGITNGVDQVFYAIVTDDGQGNLSVVWSSDLAGEHQLVAGAQFTIVNTYGSKSEPTEPTDGQITIFKDFQGEGAQLKGGDFNFTITAAGDYGDKVSPATLNGTNDVQGNVTFDGGFVFTAAGTYSFVIDEIEGTDQNVTYDKNTYMVTAKVTDNGDGTLSVEWSLVGEPASEQYDIVFTNVYDEPYIPPTPDPDPSDPSKPDIDVDKKLDGRDIVAGEFSFKIAATGDNADYVTPKALTGAVDASGNVSFSGKGFVFDKTGEYEFTVSEVLPGDDDPETPGVQHNGVTYDETTYTITAKVTKGAGNKLVVSWDLGAVAPGVTFHNEYEPDETAKVTVNATKVLIGRDLAAGEFTFELVDAQGNVVGTATNNADGSVSFSPLEFTEAGTYTYTLREVTGGLANVTYDTTVHTVTITVVDNGDGTLTATVTYDSGSGAAPVFTNTCKVPDQPGKPEEPSEPERPDTPKIPDAGDHTNVALPAFLAVGGAALIACACLLKLRKSR